MKECAASSNLEAPLFCKPARVIERESNGMRDAVVIALASSCVGFSVSWKLEFVVFSLSFGVEQT